MTERPSRFGVGPKIGLPAALAAVAAWFATRAWFGVCLPLWAPQAVLMALAVILLSLGVPIWLAGVFALVRHPVYSAWIVFLLPGIALLFRSWPILLAPLVAYAIFKRLIHREDEYLQQRFGQAYLDYRARVNEVCPFPWLWK